MSDADEPPAVRAPTQGHMRRRQQPEEARAERRRLAQAAAGAVLLPAAQTRDVVFTVLAALVLIRAVNGWSLRTFFQPDEYFQSLEPAWAIAFGPDSGAWLTWVGGLLSFSTSSSILSMPHVSIRPSSWAAPLPP